jgi:hypothetical protein
MEDKSEQINIYLKSENDREKVLKDASPYAKYIILVNDALHLENNNLQKENMVLETQVEELTNECGRNEKGQTGTKGFLHNLVLIQELADDKSKKYKQIQTETVETVQKYRNKAVQHFRYLQVGLVILSALFWEFKFFTMEQQLVVCFLMALYTAFHHSTLQDLTLPSFKKYTEELKEVEIKLVDLRKGNDFLHEYIDLL